MIRSRVRAAAVTSVAAALSILTAAAAVASAPSPEAAAATASNAVALVSQTPWVRSEAGMRLAVSVRSTLPRDQLALEVTLYTAVQDRSYFDQVLTGDTTSFGIAGSPVVVPLTNAGVMSSSGTASLDLPVSANGLPGSLPRTSPTNGGDLTVPCTDSCPGVYPLQVALLDTGNDTVLHSFMTFMTLAPNLASTRLRFAVVFPIGTTAAWQPDGTPDPAALAAGEQELEMLATALHGRSSVSASLALFPQFTSAMAAEAALAAKAKKGSSELADASAAKRGLTALHRLVSSGQVQFETEPYSAIDVAALADGGAESEIPLQFTAAARADAAAKIAPVAGNYVAPYALGPRGLALLAREGITHLVVPSDSVTPVPAAYDYPVWAPFFVTHTSVRADASDYDLERHLESRVDPVLRANQFLADLAELYFEYPNALRGVSLLAPPDWTPTSEFLTTLLGGLSSSPMVKSVTMSALFAEVPPGSAEGQSPGESPLSFRDLQALKVPVLNAVSGQAISDARGQLAELETLIPAETVLLNQLDRAILLSETAKQFPSTRATWLDTVSSRLTTEANRVSLPGISRTITVTSLRARVPISIYSTAKTPLHVDIVLTSPAKDLAFHRVVRDVTLHSRNNIIEVEVTARTTGDFPLRLTVTTTSGAYELARGGLTIRSTAISEVAVWLTAGAGAFLVLWWGRSVLSRRRRGEHARKRRRGEPAGPAEPVPDVPPPDSVPAAT